VHADELPIGARAVMVAAALNEIREGWRVEDEGLVRGPGTLAVGVTETTRMNLVTSTWSSF
jgi:hypothetical protein